MTVHRLRNRSPRSSDALKNFAMKLRELQPFPPLPTNGVNHMHMFNSMHSTPMMSTPPVTLYSSAPPSVTNPQPNPPSAPSLNSPKNAPPSASNSPQKQHKTIPQQSQASSSSSTAPTASPSVSSSAIPGNNVPSKRKQASETSSPTTATPELPPKRTRKRRQTGAG
jgi:hypothetical protein